MTVVLAAVHTHSDHLVHQGALAELLSVAGLIALLVAVIVVVGRRHGTDRYRPERNRPRDDRSEPRRGDP